MTLFSLAALVLAFCLLVLGSVNIANVLVGSKQRRGIKRRAEVPPPSGRNILFLLVGASTLLLFILGTLYVLLAWFGLEGGFPLGVVTASTKWRSSTGRPDTLRCWSWLFVWSVLARGRYSVSWSMPLDHKLIITGPYRYIRHPSYAAYFLMFVGLFLTWLNLVAAIPLLGIPGYVMMTSDEERMLTLRFGNTYVEYQKKTGKFLPKL